MKLYLKYLAIHLKSQMQYKMSFFLTALGQFIVSFTSVLGVYFLMARFQKVAGFELYEVLLCYAVILMAFSLAECFGNGFQAFPRMIGNGEFDRMLVRPRNEVFQVIAARADFSNIGRFLQAVLLLAVSIPMSGITWNADRIITLVLMILCGAVIVFGVYVLCAAFSFFTIEGLEFLNVLTYGGRDFGRYPFSVYGKGVLLFLTFCVPLAAFQYYPLLYLLGKSTNPLYQGAPLFGLIFLVPCYLFWKFGLRHHKSTGS